MKKKLLSVLLSLAMIFSLLPVSAFAAEGDQATSGKTFPDVANHWGKESVERWAGYGVLNGDDKGNFNPDASMTRAEFSTMLVNLMGYTTKGTNNFGDVKAGDWYADAILKLAAAGIMKGDGQNANPNAAISRQEAAVLLCRVFGISGGSSTSFADNGSIASWAIDSVAALYARDMIAGVGGNQFAPLDNINRASVAKMIDNMISTYVASGTATVDKSTDGIVLVAGGSVTVKEGVTVANLVVAPKASGSTVTVEKNATVTTMDVAGANATVKGAGTVKTMTVTGNGATVDKAVTVGKLVNDSSSDVKYGDKTIKAGESSDTKSEEPTKPSGGGGGGGGGGTKPKPPTDLGTADSVADFTAKVNSATGNISMKLADSITTLGADAVILTNNNVTGLTLDLNKVTAGNLTINSTSATSITLNGSSAKLTSLTINTPNADVTNNVETTTVTIQAVKGDSYRANAASETIKLAGPGHVVVTTPPTNAIVVETAEPVKLSGGVKALESKNGSASITLASSEDSVAISGKADTLSTSAPVVLESGAELNNVEVTGNKLVEIGTKDAANTKVGTLTAKAPVTVNAPVETVVASQDVTVGEKGSVDSLGVTGNNATITVANPEKVKEITKSNPSTNVKIKDTNGNTVNIPVILKSNPPAGTYAGVRPDAPNASTGKITGLTVGLEYQKEGATGADAWKKVTAAGDITDLAAGTYLIRVAEKIDTTNPNETLIYAASEPVKVTVPAAVAVSSAAITGNAVVGQTLTAVANSDATNDAKNPLTYTWTIPDSSASATNGVKTLGSGKTLKVPAEAAKQTITLTIQNFEGTAGVTATILATADKTALTDLIAQAQAKTIGVSVKDEGTKATDVPNGIRFVEEQFASALPEAINAAVDVIDGPMNAEEIATHTKALNDAMTAYKPVEGSATATADNLKAELGTLSNTAEDLLESAKVDTAAINVAPTANWVTEAEAEALSGVLAEAGKLLEAAAAPTVNNLTKAVNDLTAAMATFQKAMKPGAPIDTTALTAAISEANTNAKSVTSAANGDNVLPSEKWVSPDAMTAYTGAIGTATNTTAKTQADVNKALAALTAATATFNAAKKNGTKDVTAPKITGLVAERTSDATAKVTFNTNESGSYRWSKDGGKTWSDKIAIDVAGTVTFNVDALEKGKTYTITVEVSDAGTTVTTGNVAVKSVEAPDYSFDPANVTKANLHDTRNESQDETIKAQAIADEDLYATYYVTGTKSAENADHDVLVTITTTLLREHMNAANPAASGGWVGFEAPKPDGAVSFKYAFDTTLAGVNNAENLKDGDMKDLAFYANAGDYSNAKTWVKIVWTIGTENPTTQTVIYKMDLTNVKKGFEVIFATGNGSAGSEIVAEGATVTQPTAPTKDGYTFGGWYTDQECTDAKVYDFTTPVTADITLYAKWTASTTPADKYTVTFALNGGTGTAESIQVEKNGTVTEPTDIIKTGYTLEGWYTDADFSGSKWVFGAEGTKVTADTTLYAKWTVSTSDALVAALKTQDTVTLGADLSIDAGDLGDAWRGRKVTLDLNKNTLTITKSGDKDETVFVGPANRGTTEESVSAAPGSGGNCALTDVTICNGNVNAQNVTNVTTGNFCVETGHKLTFGDVGVKLSATGTALLVRGNNAELNVKDSTITTQGVYAVSTNAKSSVNHNVKINIQDSTLETETNNGDDCPVMINVPCTVNISGSTIIGQRMGMLVRAGDVTVTNTKISASIGKYYSAGILDYYTEKATSKSGNEAPWGAVVVTKSLNTGYSGDVSLTLTGCTLSCTLASDANDAVTDKYCSALYAAKQAAKNDNSDFTVTMTDCTVEKGNVVDLDEIVTGYTNELTDIPTETPAP